MGNVSLRSLSKVILAAILASACGSQLATEQIGNEQSEIATTERQAMVAQAPVLAASEMIQGAVDAGDDWGFSGMEVSSENELVLYWAGSLSDAMKAVIAQANQIAPVEIRQAPYSLKTLTSARDRLVDLQTAHPEWGITSISVPPDGSGLEIYTDGSDGAAVALQSLELGVPVNVKVAVWQIRDDSRLNDTSPYKGGARLKFRNGMQCTSGYAVGFNGRNHILTAKHCSGSIGDKVWNGSATRLDDRTAIGEVTGLVRDQDMMRITVNNSVGRFYDGNVGAGEFLQKVRGIGGVNRGTRVCMSGSVSGANCSARVVDTDQATPDPAVPPHLVRVECDRNRFCNQSGDSGSPVFTIPGDWNGRTAVGVLKGRTWACGLTDFRCIANGDVPSATNRGYVFTKISYVWSTWPGAFVKTEP